MRVRTAIGVAAASLVYAASALGASGMPRFRVTYAGAGSWSTIYHSTPSNPGGNPDTNDASDSSSQRWSVTFIPLLRWRPGTLRPERFELVGARGMTRASGSVDHTHRDGLFAFDDTSIQCRVAASPLAHERLSAGLEVTYLPASRRLRLTALNPVAQVLDLLPQQCPGQGDSLDGLNDNYFMPGFSFAAGYGPDRWFRSRSVLIPVATLERVGTISVHLGPGPGAAPPADCAVPNPSWQRCRTSGAWHGTLTLRRLG